jgi:hypothetical protein
MMKIQFIRIDTSEGQSIGVILLRKLIYNQSWSECYGFRSIQEAAPRRVPNIISPAVMASGMFTMTSYVNPFCKHDR